MLLLLRELLCSSFGLGLLISLGFLLSLQSLLFGFDLLLLVRDVLVFQSVLLLLHSLNLILKIFVCYFLSVKRLLCPLGVLSDLQNVSVYLLPFGLVISDVVLGFFQVN